MGYNTRIYNRINCVAAMLETSGYVMTTFGEAAMSTDSTSDSDDFNIADVWAQAFGYDSAEELTAREPLEFVPLYPSKYLSQELSFRFDPIMDEQLRKLASKAKTKKKKCFNGSWCCSPEGARQSETNFVFERDGKRHKVCAYCEILLSQDTSMYSLRKARQWHMPNAFTASDWRDCLEYFDNSCAVCGAHRGLWHTLAKDHWIPVSDPNCPGTVPTNIVPLCHGVDGCNNSKSKKNPNVWLVQTFGERKARIIETRIQKYFALMKERGKQ